jgi:leucyl aminopeptidase
VQVFERADCRKMGMGAFLGVAAGSEQPPKFIHLTYTPKGRSRRRVAVIGKGITFDSGGLDLKTAEGMLRMKDDMSGAAAVLGIMKALPQLRPALEVHGLIAATENMPSGTATRPGDVLRAMNGTTIEIGNTDAEGRLTLADAICYASQKVGAEEIIDMATLTGACVVALGPLCSGLFANDQALADRLLAAAETAGERVWQLPLIEEYRENLKSDVADLNNVGPRGGGAITAGLFLKEFAGDKPWAHLDIAGPAFIEKDTPLAPKGATGYAVRTILTYLIEAGR